MKKIIMLGNSIAGIKALEEIRKADQECELTVYPLEDYLPYYPSLLVDFFAQNITQEQLQYQPPEYYQKHNIRFALDKKIKRINFARKRLVIDEESDYPYHEYDELIVTDTDAHDFPELKGTGKAGVFGMRRMTDFQAILKNLPLIEHVILYSNSFRGLKMAYALAQLKKDVIWVTSEKYVLSRLMDEESGRFIHQQCEKRGIRIIFGSSIEEILGDAEVKAIRLQSGKVYASQMVILGELACDLRLFKESPVVINDRIEVDASFRTKTESILALDGVCSRGVALPGDDDDNISDLLEQQGRQMVLAEASPAHVQHFTCRSWQMGDFSVVVLGHAKQGGGMTALTSFADDPDSYERIVLDKNFVKGAVLINRLDQCDRISQLIKTRANILQILKAEDDPDLSQILPGIFSNAGSLGKESSELELATGQRTIQAP